jgi:hypothetical protein
MWTANAGGTSRRLERKKATRRSDPINRAALALAMALVAAAASGALPAQEAGGAVATAGGTPIVHAFYLVPSDHQAKPIYAVKVRNALLDLQAWYQRAMGGGVTFRLADPVVQTVALPHTAAFYSSDPNDVFGFFNSVLHDAFPLTGGKFFDQQNIWLYYVDADTACPQVTGATSSVALLPANDLRGLNGETTINPCGGTYDQFPPNRWIGGLGHEIGIAIGLSHPAGCDQGQPSCDSGALMWLGFYNYPDCHLTHDDVAKLGQSPFFLPGTCVANGSTLCSNLSRFEVSGAWATPDGQAGTAQAVQLTPDTGYFYFFSPSNVEAVIKVLNGCGIDQAYWVFAGGLTNVNAQIRVRDVKTGQATIYVNPQGQAFQPIQDTAAFHTCSVASGNAASDAAPEAAASAGYLPLASVLAPPASTQSVLLNNGRFQIDVTFVTKDGNSGVGTPVQLTSDTAYFWFFNSANVEMVVKVLNGCGLGGNYWVFAGGLTNVRVVMTVTDTHTGKSNRYVNLQDTPFQPLQDTSAFPSCP